MNPLYTQDDAEQVIRQMRPVNLHEPTVLGGSTKEEGFSISLTNAGHMLGSTCVLVEASERGQKTRLLFSGDVGRKDLPIIKDPDAAPAADYLIMESTYGNRPTSTPGAGKAEAFTPLIKRVAARGGRIIVPAFAVERTQQLVMLLHELTLEGEIPEMPIFVDSPLASAVTEVFRMHTEDWDREINDSFRKGVDPLDGSGCDTPRRCRRVKL